MAGNSTQEGPRPPQQLSKDKAKRQKQLAQLKLERQQKVRAAKRRQQRIRGLQVGISAVVVAGLAVGAAVWIHADSSKKKSSSDAAASSTATAAATPTPTASPTYQQWKTAPAMSIDTKAKYDVSIKTNDGTIKLTLDPSTAPTTVNSFVFLAKKGYFNNVTCHRLTTSGIYVLQCGDPSGTGSGGPGYSFKDENLTAFGKAGSSGTVTYPAGTVAMANSGANTNGSQFFLVYKDSPLAPSYTPFGTISGGMDVLKSIAAKGTGNGTGDGAPKGGVTMQTVTATKA